MQTEIPVSRTELRKFGLMFGLMIALMFGGVLPWLFAYPHPRWPLVAGTAFALIALALPVVLRPLYLFWMRFAHMLGTINTRIILFLVFAVLFVPIGLLLRLFRGLQFDHRIDRQAETYLIRRTDLKLENLERPF